MIDFINVWKSYGAQEILKDVSFKVSQGERTGLVGPNGTGKTTIFEIITGDTTPDRGTVAIQNGLRFGYLKQQLAKQKDLPLLDFTADAVPELPKMAARLHDIEEKLHRNIVAHADKPKLLKEQGELQHQFEHFGGYRLRHEAEAALCGLGFRPEDLQRNLNSFSGGWQMRAALARVLLSAPDVLLLDEPSNYLDIPAIEWLYRFLRSFAGTLMLISHDRYLLKSLTSIIIEVNGGKVTRYPGDYDFYRRERQARLIAMEAARKNQDKRKEQLTRSIERFRAKSTKAAQVQSWVKALDKMEEIKLPERLHYSGSIMLPPPPPSGAETAGLEQLSFSYDGKTPILENINLQINRGDKIAIVGYNGAGKTTLLRLLAGRLLPQSGKRILGHNVVIGYQAQEFAEILPPDRTVLEVVRNALPAGGSVRDVQSVLGAFGFTGDHVYKTCKVLSGGEKIRLCFAAIFVNPPNFLVLDEPTTHLDIASREALQQTLKNYRGTLCLVSHDIEFVANVADVIVAMATPSIKKYHGNYFYYREKCTAEQPRIAEQPAGAGESEADRGLKKEKRRERARQRAELMQDKKSAMDAVKKLEMQIEALEQEKNELAGCLAAGTPGTDFAAISRRLKKIQEAVELASSKWETAAEQLEEILALNAAVHNL